MVLRFYLEVYFGDFCPAGETEMRQIINAGDQKLEYYHQWRI